MSGLARIIGGAAVAGVIVGGSLGLFGVGSSDAEPGMMALDAVPVFACPGEGQIGTLHRGDRVFITGQSDGWLAVRNVRGGGERVFVAAAAVTPDADLANLPDEDCDDVGLVSVAISDITTTSAVGSTTTTVVGSTTTSSSTTTSTTTTSTTTTSTTTTVALPSVSSPSANPNPIWEKYPGFASTCPGDGTTSISASVSAPAGIQSVALSWSSAAGAGSQPMSASGATYTGSFGPFDANGAAVPQGESIPVTVTVTVVDSLGRDASAQTVVTLNDCTFT